MRKENGVAYEASFYKIEEKLIRCITARNVISVCLVLSRKTKGDHYRDLNEKLVLYSKTF